MKLRLSWALVVGLFLFFSAYLITSIGGMAAAYMSPGQVLAFIVVWFILFIAATVLVLCE